MRFVSRFNIFIWVILFGWTFGTEIAWAQSGVVDVAPDVIVSTKIILPVGSVSTFDHTYLKICADDSLLAPSFKVYPAGGAMFNALVPPKSLEPIWINLKEELFAIGDVLLSQDSATHVYTLKILHYKDSGGALGRSDNGVLDNWLLEISHEDDVSHGFYFTIGHTQEVEDPLWYDPVSGIDFVWVPGGCFQMGCVSGIECEDDEKPVHEVCLDGFWMGKTEVTQEQWKMVAALPRVDQPLTADPSYFKGLRRPVEQVTWEDAVEFCKRLSKETGRSYRLPTEAEWEYAARAGTRTAYNFGKDARKLGDYAWFSGNSYGTTHPVGGKEPNAWGLYDMHGNVLEWCQDRYARNYYLHSPKENPQGPASGSRVFRGGGWVMDDAWHRSANRTSYGPDHPYFALGFRLVRTPYNVPQRVSVTTPMTLPVGNVNNPTHTYLKICADDSLLAPSFKVYPAGGAMFNALVPPKSLEPIWINLKEELFAIGDVLLSQDEDSATNVYTLNIFHYKDNGGALGTSSNNFLDTWLLEIDHEDGQPHQFYFTIGHTQEVEDPLWHDPVSDIDFVWVPPGCFQMGCVSGFKCEDNEKPVHEVCLDGFWMGKTEVTQEQWKTVAALPKIDHPLIPDPSLFKGKRRPVERVSWEDAMEFCKRLSKETGRSYRLPTEAEWEYAARAGTRRAYNFGNDASKLGEYAWYEGNSVSQTSPWGHPSGQTHPVGQLKPNAWGLYDMHGNVSEWCQDWYDENYYSVSPEKNPPGPASVSERVVLRGCTWSSTVEYCRAAFRNSSPPGYSNPYIGFRLVKTP